MKLLKGIEKYHQKGMISNNVSQLLFNEALEAVFDISVGFQSNLEKKVIEFPYYSVILQILKNDHWSCWNASCLDFLQEIFDRAPLHHMSLISINKLFYLLLKSITTKDHMIIASKLASRVKYEWVDSSVPFKGDFSPGF